jgi:multidrug efflux system membrane fusion protein
MSTLMHKLREQPFWIALAIFVLLSLWVASGMMFTEEQDDSQARKLAKHKASPLVKVKVERTAAHQVTREISLYGRTEPDRLATLRAEVEGLVEEIFAQEGDFVKKGQKLIAIETSELSNLLTSAKASMKQREMELEGAKSLGQQGYQSKVNLAQAMANLELAASQVSTLNRALRKSLIRAPFEGVVNQRFVEVGDLLKVGDEVATLVDLDPLVISADVTETNVRKLTIGQQASGRMVSGQQLKGHIRYISSVSDRGTNTFKIEVAVPNSDFQYMAGMSTELSVPLQSTLAVRVSPSVMALDEAGNLGVKTVVDQHVKFIPIDIVKSDSQGVWLAGMQASTDVIVLGHGFVRDGDKVEVMRDQPEQNQAQSAVQVAQ